MSSRNVSPIKDSIKRPPSLDLNSSNEKQQLMGSVSQTDESVTNPRKADQDQADQENGAKSQTCRDKSIKDFWIDAIVDTVLALLSMLFVGLAIAAVVADGKSVQDKRSWPNELLSAMRYGPTLFPILFAAVVGRLMKAISYYKLERRSTVQTIEQLQGSKTIVGAFITQYKLRALNLLSAALMLLWLLSPFGGQGTLRAGAPRDKWTSSRYTYQYLDTSSPYFPADSTFNVLSANGMYISSLSSGTDSKGSPQDVWGNARVPMIEGPGIEYDEWIEFTPNSNSQYAALLGIPVNGPKLSGNSTKTSTTVDTSYWNLNCSTKVSENGTFQPANIPLNVSRTNQSWFGPTGDGGTRIAMNTSDYRTAYLPYINTTGLSQHPPDFTGMDMSRWHNHGPQRFLIQPIISFAYRGEFQALCDLTTTYIKVNISCTGRDCAPTSVYRIKTSEYARDISALDANINTMSNFIGNFIASTNGTPSFGNKIGTGPTFGYIGTPDNPFGYSQGNPAPDWTKVTPEDFGLRLSQVMNTYWIASVGYVPLQGRWQAYDPNNNTPGANDGQSAFKVLNGTGTRQDYDKVFAVSYPWVVILFISSLALFFSACATALLGLFRRCPDILDNFSSLIKDNHNITLPRGTLGSSALDGFDRARLISDLQVRMGDIRSEDGEGYIAVGIEGVGRIKKKRKFRC